MLHMMDASALPNAELGIEPGRLHGFRYPVGAVEAVAGEVEDDLVCSVLLGADDVF